MSVSARLDVDFNNVDKSVTLSHKEVINEHSVCLLYRNKVRVKFQVTFSVDR